MLVSIIINNFNYAAYVGQAIDSALAQTYKPIEVIVVDDGSTDNSREIISSYGEKIISVFQSNGGLNAACNAGWKVSKGDIVIFLDSDDVLLPDCVEKCVTTLKNTSKIKAQYYLQKVDKNLKPVGGMLPNSGMGKESDIPRDITLCGYYATPPNSGNAYTKSFLEKIMPVPEFDKRKSDYDATVDGMLCGVSGLIGGVIFIPEALGLYRVHGANMSDAGKVESVQKIRQLFMRNYLREEYQMMWAKKLGIPIEFDLSRFNPNVCKQRFLAYRLQPQGHPIATDTWLGLLVSGLHGAFRVPRLNIKKRLFIACGFIAVGILPRAALRKMIGAVMTSKRTSDSIL